MGQRLGNSSGLHRHPHEQQRRSSAQQNTLHCLVGRCSKKAQRRAERGEAVAVINQLTARYYFSNQDPIGQRITVGPPVNSKWLTIVGVVADTPTNALATSYAGQVFLPISVA